MYEPERAIDPSEDLIDGVLVCEDCEETIPGDTWYYNFRGHILCEDCMDQYRHVAPFRDEWY